MLGNIIGHLDCFVDLNAKTLYSTGLVTFGAFGNSCPLQTNTFHFPIIQSHHVQLSSNKFQSCYERLARKFPCMWYPLAATFKVKLAIIKTGVFSHWKGTHIHVFLHNICHIYVSYHILFKGIYFVLSYSTQRWTAYVTVNLLKIEKRQKWSMPITKIKHVQLFWT